MIAYDAPREATLADARDAYFRYNNFGADGGYAARWVDIKIGPLATPFPNTDARRRAVRFHDLHHVLTGYATDWRGEFEISAWEIASGCARHWAAWQLNLGGMAAGAATAPKRTFRAFVRGRRTGNLYRARYDEVLLGRRVEEVRRELALDREVGAATVGDAVWFAGAVMAGVVVGTVFAVAMVPAVVGFHVAGRLRKRRAVGAF